MKKRIARYLVIFEKTKTGYSAYAPDLPGCIATGKTRKETEQTIYETILFHLEGLKEENLETPPALAESEILSFGA